MVESGVPDFEISAWIAIVGKSGTPPDVVAKLNGGDQQGDQRSGAARAADDAGIEFVGGSVDDAQGFVRRELEKWTKVVKAAGISGS
jgi:tripartite-type tricarboxylate transporter receptor subunit TctC